MLLRAAKRADPEHPHQPALALDARHRRHRPMVYGRYDLVVTATAVAALTVTLRSKRSTAVAPPS